MDKFSNRTGKSERAQAAIYNIFIPNKLPFELKLDMKLMNALEQATTALGVLSGVGTHLHNPHLLIAPYVKKEAVLSSKIEGTKTTLDELFLSEKGKAKEKNPDAEEVNNYVKALNKGLQAVENSPVSQQLIKKLHGILMKGVRGEDKNPGKYKVQQNWIGSNYDILDARFVPAPPDKVETLMNNLIQFLDEESTVPDLVKIGLAHYQFETIHPFRDGNGRLGRLIIILYLCYRKKLSQPLLYVSAYFSKHKKEYTEKLYNVSANGEIEEWLIFFFEAITEQANDAIIRTNELNTYNQKCQNVLKDKTSSTNVLKILDNLFTNPYITIPEAQKLIGASYTVAKYDINLLVKHGVLDIVPEEISKKISRAKMYKASKILRILDVEVSTKKLQEARQTSIQSFS